MNLRKKTSLHKNNNNNKGRQLLQVLRLYISVALQQKTGNFKVAILSTEMKWGALPEEKQKNELAQKEFRFMNNNNDKGRQLPPVRCLYISVALQQKTANFKVVAIQSRVMQWGHLTERNQKDELAA